MTEISIITSMYNKNKETLNVVDKLFFNSIKNHGSKNRELIILDDFSPLKDETEKLFKRHERKLKSLFKRVIFKRHEKNLGFGGSFNAGIKMASGKILILVNDDVYLTKNSVSELARTLLKSKTYGICGPITGEKNTWTIQYCKQAPKLEGYSISDFKRIEEFAEYAHNRFPNETIKTKTVAGFCFAVPALLIRKLGGFDESFKFGLWEDVDLSKRISKDYDVLVNPGIYVHHGSLNGISNSTLQHPFKIFYRFFSNGLVYSKKWRNFYEVFFYILRGEYRALTGFYTVSSLFK